MQLTKFEFDMEEDPLCTEVEDIMSDQGIITAELNVDIQTTSSTVSISTTRFRLAVALIARAVFPPVVDVYYAYLRNQKNVVESFRRQILPTLFAFLANSLSRSLSSVHRGICYPLSLRALIQRPQPAVFTALEDDDETPEKCVECSVLYEPSECSEISVDVIFIHGIHGSLVKTWKQGLWQTEKHKIKQAIMERSKSTGEFDIVFPKTPLKRSVSDDYSSRPSKFYKMENSNSYVNNSLLELEEDIDEESMPSYSKCWPKDWLSKDCPGARVIALNYTTDPHLWRPVWIKKKNRSGMVERSKEMIDHLLKLNVGRHPIIWVGHSKGGLYVKQILIHAWENNEPNLRNLHMQSKGIMFYSVPHRGSSLADFTLPFLRRSVELLEVQRNCLFVLNLHDRFLEMLNNSQFQPEIFSFIETSLTFMSFLYIRIVAYESADPGIGSKWGVPLDHREICKPSSRNCIIYKELLRLIEKVICSEKT